MSLPKRVGVVVRCAKKKGRNATTCKSNFKLEESGGKVSSAHGQGGEIYF